MRREAKAEVSLRGNPGGRSRPEGPQQLTDEGASYALDVRVLLGGGGGFARPENGRAGTDEGEPASSKHHRLSCRET